MAIVLTCMRCGRPGGDDLYDWLPVAGELPDSVGVICPTCLTPDEHAEMIIREATPLPGDDPDVDTTDERAVRLLQLFRDGGGLARDMQQAAQLIEDATTRPAVGADDHQSLRAARQLVLALVKLGAYTAVRLELCEWGASDRAFREVLAKLPTDED